MKHRHMGCIDLHIDFKRESSTDLSLEYTQLVHPF